MPKSFPLIALAPCGRSGREWSWRSPSWSPCSRPAPALAQLGSTGAPPVSPRATWVVRDALLSPNEIRRMVDDAAKAGITDLFVQVRGRGDAYYESDLVPPGPPLLDSWRRFGHYDPLAMVLDLAHEHDIRVHAWLNVYLVWSGKEPPDGHVVLEHPEWVASDRDGTSMAMMSKRAFESAWTEGVYLDPGRRDVVQHFLDVVRELVERYPVDGIHLDYARYPVMDVGYNEAMRAGFRRRTGVDPMELEANASGLKRERGDDGYAELLGEWRDFKAAQVTALVGAVRGLTQSMKPGIMLSAAVKPDAKTARDRGRTGLGALGERGVGRCGGADDVLDLAGDGAPPGRGAGPARAPGSHLAGDRGVQPVVVGGGVQDPRLPRGGTFRALHLLLQLATRRGKEPGEAEPGEVGGRPRGCGRTFTAASAGLTRPARSSKFLCRFGGCGRVPRPSATQ